jgi:hypothetical protein
MSRFLTTTQPSVHRTTDGSRILLIIVASVCFAIIFVLFLLAVACCTWIHQHAPLPAPANKGLKKKILKRLLKVTYSVGEGESQSMSDCPICISEFEEGDEIRILPTCKHMFHVTCINMWFASHSSCPSCCQKLTLALRRSCGADS